MQAVQFHQTVVGELTLLLYLLVQVLQLSGPQSGHCAPRRRGASASPARAHQVVTLDLLNGFGQVVFQFIITGSYLEKREVVVVMKVLPYDK